MKTLQVLDQTGTILLSDALNQRILRELVLSECSVTDLARRLNIPTLKLWRRMQRLTSANMVELSRLEKTANLEKKLYRSVATTFVPQNFLEFKPKDPRLLEAFNLYAEIQKAMMVVLSKFSEVPKDVYPVDYALYASMQAYVEVCGNPKMQAKIAELGDKLSKYQASNPSLEKNIAL